VLQSRHASAERHTVAVRTTLHLLVARENLRRAEAGLDPLTQREIAEGSGLAQSVISGLLRRKATRIDLDTIAGLCRYFNVQPGDLFEYTPD
jgi:putative transcriptional regulator